MDKSLLAPCGLYCGSCPYFEKERSPNCPGCGYLKGHLFWGDCKLYACATEHRVEHCGACRDFPCSLFVESFDPEQGQKSAFERLGLLVYRNKFGTEKYLEMAEKLK